MWCYVAGVAETSYVGHCFTQPWLYNERCFPVGLSAAITCCVLHKNCVCPHVSVCDIFTRTQYLHTAAIFLPMASTPEDIWFPPAKASGQQRSLEVRNPTANLISYSWWTPESAPLVLPTDRAHPSTPPLYLLPQRSLLQP